MTQFDLFAASSEIPETRRARYDVDKTPVPVVEQVTTAVVGSMLGEGTGKRILDLCAGSGAWAMVCRKLYPKAHITALELREEERVHLERWADEVVLGDVAEIVDGLGTFDLIIGNPPFSLDDERVPAKADKAGNPPPPGAVGKSRLRAFEVLVVAMRKHLRDEQSRLALYVPSAWWQRSEALAELVREHNPCRQLNVPLGICHRGPGTSADDKSYCAYVWAREPHGIGWQAMDLPVLKAHQRRWSVVPGTELVVIE